MNINYKESILQLKTSKNTNYLSKTIHPIIFKHKLSNLNPIPIVRRSLPNNSKIRKRLAIYGYKYFSKFGACGPDTSLILKNATKSRTLKYINSFEFDPYLCDESCIKELRESFRRLKYVKKFNLIIRRTNELNESDMICPFLYRMLKLKSFRLEINNPSNIDEKGLIKLYIALLKCQTLEFLDLNVLDVPGRTSKSNRYMDQISFKLTKLKESRFYELSNKGSDRQDCHIDKNFSYRERPKLRNFLISWNVTSEWNLVNESGSTIELDVGLKMMSSFSNLTYVSLRNIRYKMGSDETLMFLKTLLSSPSVRHLEFECLGCLIDDREVLIVAYALSMIPYLTSFTFKVIQKSSISQGCIETFTQAISKLKNLQNFNLYFRKVDFPEPVMNKLVEKLISLENIQCCSTTQSLHIFKRS